jgi:hypothetical protein
MIVVARNNGPLYFGRRMGLLEGKEYKVISWSYQKPLGNWIRRTDDFINPKKASFFIKVINENGEAADFWNDYFLSSEEMRDIKIDKILK